MIGLIGLGVPTGKGRVLFIVPEDAEITVAIFPGSCAISFYDLRLIDKFSIERVHKGGAKFDFEKAKWYNHEWIKRSSVDGLKLTVKKILDEAGIPVTNDKLLGKVISLVKDRCILLTDFPLQSFFLLT